MQGALLNLDTKEWEHIVARTDVGTIPSIPSRAGNALPPPWTLIDQRACVVIGPSVA
jgi:hypothetical protein